MFEKMFEIMFEKALKEIKVDNGMFDRDALCPNFFYAPNVANLGFWMIVPTIAL